MLWYVAELSPLALQGLFDGLKKKKKKKKAPAFDDIAVEEAPAEPEPEPEPEVQPEAAEPVADEDGAALFADLKKKKKKKKVVLEGDEEAAPVEEAPAEEALDFGEKKKKKSKRPNLAEFEASLKADEEEGAVDVDGNDESTGGAGQGQDAWLGSNRDYTYQELLTRVFAILRQNNPELAGEKRKYTIAPPQVFREGSKKSVFANITDICRRMHRQPDHVIQYFLSELGTTGSVDGSQRLVIKGRFQQKQIENVLKRYIMEYVTCKTCKSQDTILIKENRLFFVQCESCGCRRSVAAIKAGFKAQTEKRAAQRAAAGV
ncbi:domain found in IF2B/IF5-domain-containing protein [Polychytrium aggregatum]|uniref:domain found in IF2B/IF5-domain-containing protein n=1 Tax=Polychytrium aggregatum TaxID=110093 RepID=UPI0022FED1A8|nr:domain found in IF2B/IF5-domain-containing protein [Polychytrium aggregatum]KAI9193605.1 domain found in IF2B/IF5-domain-containing protein [Polychytrium aggregatum]